jgi:hypothetical protein
MHKLDEMVDLVPDENPLKAALRQVQLRPLAVWRNLRVVDDRHLGQLRLLGHDGRDDQRHRPLLQRALGRLLFLSDRGRLLHAADPGVGAALPFLGAPML